MNVARELSLHGSVGDRAVILAPQGLDYILAFLGSMQAGLVAVPLPLPHRGSSHDRVECGLRRYEARGGAHDVRGRRRCRRLGRSVTVGHRAEDRRDRFVGSGRRGRSSLELADLPSIAYLQYSSGSTRLPTGVMISHRNLQANFEQLMRPTSRSAHSDPPLMPRSCRGCRSITTWVWCWASAHRS